MPLYLTVKTGPSFTEAAMGRLAQGTKVLAEGGYEKIFKQTFEVLPDEELKICYACYLSTSAGPVMGVLYISTAKIAFCSDNPLSYKAGNKTEWSYYKVRVTPFLASSYPYQNQSSFCTSVYHIWTELISIVHHC